MSVTSSSSSFKSKYTPEQIFSTAFAGRTGEFTLLSECLSGSLGLLGILEALVFFVTTALVVVSLDSAKTWDADRDRLQQLLC